MSVDLSYPGGTVVVDGIYVTIPAGTISFPDNGLRVVELSGGTFQVLTGWSEAPGASRIAEVTTAGGSITQVRDRRGLLGEAEALAQPGVWFASMPFQDLPQEGASSIETVLDNLGPGDAGLLLTVEQDLTIGTTPFPQELPTPAQGDPGDVVFIGTDRTYQIGEPGVAFALQTDPFVLSNGVSIRTGDGPPVSISGVVTGTHAGDVDRGGLFVDTDGPTAWLNDGSLDVPVWLPTTQVADAGPVDPTRSEVYGTIYEDTDAYGIDPTSGWWRNAGDDVVPNWYEITSVVAESFGSATPTDGVAATSDENTEPGSIYLDRNISGATGIYQQTAPADAPVWQALGGGTGGGSYPALHFSLVASADPADGAHWTPDAGANYLSIVPTAQVLQFDAAAVGTAFAIYPILPVIPVTFRIRFRLGGFNGVDLTVDAADDTVVRSAAREFTADDVGRTLVIGVATGWTPGNYVIDSVTDGAATLHSSAAAVTITNGVWSMATTVDDVNWQLRYRSVAATESGAPTTFQETLTGAGTPAASPNGAKYVDVVLTPTPANFAVGDTLYLELSRLADSQPDPAVLVAFAGEV
jgi:hypothetical protein